MPHIAITMLPGRDKAVKAKLAPGLVREAVSKELGIGAEYVSVSVEDVERGTLGRVDAENSCGNGV